ncbi:MAG: hypothetical protein AB1894_05145 [Chloroflexota bacterium]
MPANLDGLIWLLLLLGPLLILQRNLHREIQAVLLLLTRRSDISLALFSLLFFPGVLLHEGSHYLAARLMGVRTGRFSLLPQPLGNGRLQLGFVETAATDWGRDALIGVAPLLTGGAFVAYAGVTRLGLVAAWDLVATTGLPAWRQALASIYNRPDFWLWFYLTVAVSSTMMPSESDRRSWLPLGLAAGLLVAVSIVAGAGPWLLANLAPWLNRGLQAVAVVFGIGVLIHLLLLPPFWLWHRLLSHLFGMDVA